MPINVTKNWLLGENSNTGLTGVGSGSPTLELPTIGGEITTYTSGGKNYRFT